MLNYDVTLAWASLLLLAIGLVMVYSASIAMAEASAYTGYRPWYFLARHAVFVVAGLLAALVALQVPLKGWQRAAPYLFILGAMLLVAVLVPALGKQVNGSKRWLSLYLVNLQPSELMKLFVVLYAASYAVRKASFLHAEQPLRQTLLKGFLPLLAVMIATGALLLHEPDFGACVVIVAIAFSARNERAGARPSPTADSNIDGVSPSMTIRMSLVLGKRTQPGVALAASAAQTRGQRGNERRFQVTRDRNPGDGCEKDGGESDEDRGAETGAAATKRS